ncbi:thioredoxin family protein [Thermosulfuriphilus sp.]
MKTKRLIEVFSAGCPLCQETVKLVQQLAYPSYEVKVIGLNDPQGLKRAQELGVKTVPAVAIDGQLAACCQNRGPREKTLRLAGLGYPLKEGNQEDPQ